MSSYKITCKLNDTTYNTLVGSGDVSATSGDAEQMLIQNIGTSEESITILGDITSGNGPYYAYFENLDATNYVEVGSATTVYWMQLQAGDKALLPLASGIGTLYLKANTAAVDVRIKIIERAS